MLRICCVALLVVPFSSVVTELRPGYTSVAPVSAIELATVRGGTACYQIQPNNCETSRADCPTCAGKQEGCMCISACDYLFISNGAVYYRAVEGIPGQEGTLLGCGTNCGCAPPCDWCQCNMGAMQCCGCAGEIGSARWCMTNIWTQGPCCPHGGPHPH